MKFLFFSKNLIIGFLDFQCLYSDGACLNQGKVGRELFTMVSGTNSGYGVHRCFNLETKLAWLIVAN